LGSGCLVTLVLHGTDMLSSWVGAIWVKVFLYSHDQLKLRDTVV
jgi:hypothetical protein